MSYDYLTSHARLLQDGHAKFARLSQDKAIRRTVFPQQPTAIVRFSVVVVRFEAFLRQHCDKAHDYLEVVLRLS